jgi:tRNA (guanine-N7-)-methyltransferase
VSEHQRKYFYGRRKGHPLTALQAERLARLLPQLRPDFGTPAPRPLAGLFGSGISEVWLEIGFGGGEHLAWQAERNPKIGIIGAEPFVNGVAHLATSIEQHRLANVRVHDGEVQELLAWLPVASIARAFILFPDPWPKRRHHKRRLVSVATLQSLARVMGPGAELRIATDIGDYMRTTLQAVLAEGNFVWPALSPADWRQRPADWPATRYEAKALAAGRRCAYFRFQRA